MTLNEKLLITPKLFARENDIIQWGIERSIIGDYANGTFKGQQEKTRQEWQEWKDTHTKDDIGDLTVTLIMQCALEKTTVSECVNSEFPHGFEPFDEVAEGMSEDSWLDNSIEELLKEGNDYTAFSINIAFAVDALYHCATKRGWTLDECIEQAWDDIKDRKGLMLYGMFIKQTNLDALQELGITYNKELQAFTGTIFLNSHLKRIDEVFYNLGITYTCTGDYSSGVYVETTGSN